MENFIGTVTPTTEGVLVDHTIVLNKYYSLAERTVRYYCSFGNTTIAKLFTCTDRLNADTTATTVFLLNIANKSVSLNDGEAQVCSILNSFDIFEISISLFYLISSITIVNQTTKESFYYELSSDGTGGTGIGKVRTPLITTGKQFDYYAFGLISGDSYFVRTMTVLSRKVDLLIYGDSISAPEGYWPKESFSNSWTQLIYTELEGNVISSGRGGTTINHINLRIKNELPFILPKYCMITIGTNGGNSTENLTSLVNYIKSLGVIPILNNIPCYSHNGDVSSFNSINSTIAAVRNAESINGCKLNIPTSINDDGITFDSSTMWEEHPDGGGIYYHHPNVSGSLRIFNKLKETLPELF